MWDKMYGEDENKMGKGTIEDCEPSPAWEVGPLCTLLYPNVPYTDSKDWRNRCKNRKVASASSGVINLKP